MVYFFGIFSPGFGRRVEADEAPGKAGFFGGLPDVALGAVPMSRAEQDACYLNGKLWEPDPVIEVEGLVSSGQARSHR